MSIVKKAIIPAAGYGTRMLPATKAIPKEMLPIVDKPAIQYIVEEAFNSGIEDILIIINRGKSAIEDHFDKEPLLEDTLRRSNKLELLESIENLHKLGNIQYIRQPEQKGLGNAVSYAKSFVGNEPFVVLYGDDVIMSDYPVTKQLIDTYEKYHKTCLGIKEVSDELIVKYSSMKVDHNERFSNYSILGRVLLTPDIFPIIDNLTPGAGGEIQLTDAIKAVAKTQGCIGVDFIGKRYDMGNKLEMLKAIVETALVHKELKDDFRDYLVNITKTLDR